MLTIFKLLGMVNTFVPMTKISLVVCVDFNHHHLVKRCFLIELISSSSDERDAIQKKTFTKWVNKHLKKVTINF